MARASTAASAGAVHPDGIDGMAAPPASSSSASNAEPGEEWGRLPPCTSSGSCPRGGEASGRAATTMSSSSSAEGGAQAALELRSRSSSSCPAGCWGSRAGGAFLRKPRRLLRSASCDGVKMTSLFGPSSSASDTGVLHRASSWSRSALCPEGGGASPSAPLGPLSSAPCDLVPAPPPSPPLPSSSLSLRRMTSHAAAAGAPCLGLPPLPSCGVGSVACSGAAGWCCSSAGRASGATAVAAARPATGVGSPRAGASPVCCTGGECGAS